jgi:hypothetical protein
LLAKKFDTAAVMDKREMRHAMNEEICIFKCGIGSGEHSFLVTESNDRSGVV